MIDGRTPKHRRIRLTMEFPEDSDEYRSDVRSWIVAKLRKQSELTNPIIEELTQGELLWDDKIEIRETIDHYGVRRSFLESDQSRKALCELRREVIEEETVNRDELVRAFREAIDQSRQSFQVIRVIDQEDSDWSQMAKQLRVIYNCTGVTVVHLAFHEAVGHGPIDVLRRISDDLSKAGCSCSNYLAVRSSAHESRQDLQSLLGQALIKDVLAWIEHSSFVLLLERVDKAESDTLHWLTRWFFPELSKENVKLLVILTEFEAEGIEEISDTERVFRLSPFTRNQIMEHLQSTFGFPLERAEDEASYLFSSTSGTPGSVYRGLSIKRMQGVSIL